MSNTDTFFVLQWWLLLFGIGVTFLPFTQQFFSRFFDYGYTFSKIFGILLLSYSIFTLGTLHLAPFTVLSLYSILGFSSVCIFFLYKNQYSLLIKKWPIFLFEELLFLLSLFFWSLIRSYQPDIHGLEKFMDFGFINSILRTTYFPAIDMWLPPNAINYYYFGHLVAAVLTKASFLSSAITYNLMVATIFAFSITASFSIGFNLFFITLSQITQKKTSFLYYARMFVSGCIAASLVSFAGNLHTIYVFFRQYQNEHPVPFWTLPFLPLTMPNGYWYPNATRFIYNTIHEFPLYSFVVSDLHGHVFDIPFVLLTLAFLFSLFIQGVTYKKTLVLALLLAVLSMTNALDGIIYLLLSFLVISLVFLRKTLEHPKRQKDFFKHIFSFFPFSTFAIHLLLLLGGFICFSLPFTTHFKPFVSGFGILCAPDYLIRIGHIGPLLFEANHCQRSPLWQLLILHGFFYFWGICFIAFIVKVKKYKASDIFVLSLIFLSTILILLPEFIYAKDIYPAHYRANTMFKLVYQAFIMLSLCCAYIMIRIITTLSAEKKFFSSAMVLVIIGLFLYILVMLYPTYAINSYYANLQTYIGLDGTTYLKNLYPHDYEAILWLNKEIKGQPVIAEAQGDSYTDYARVSANTGLPTILGWTVHEWLWRGSYDIPAARIPDIKTLYETPDEKKAKAILDKYTVALIFVGDLERQKYPTINEDKFTRLAKEIYHHGTTRVYQVNGMTW